MNRNARQALLLLLALVLYGSLYPFAFRNPELPHGPLDYLIHRWDLPTNSYMIRDIAINLALYLPIGFAAYFAFEGLSPLSELFFPLLLTAVLSTLIEVTQIYEPTRVSSMLDILANTAGTAIGVVLGVFARSLRPRRSFRVPPAIPWLFLAGLAVYRLLGVEWSGVAGDWEWIPFSRLMMLKQDAALLRLGASAVWFAVAAILFGLAGFSRRFGTVLVTATVALTELIRLFGPPLFAGITDPLVAAVSAFLALSLFPETGTRSRSAE
jgi:VanZ family protein